MHARIPNPAISTPGALDALIALSASARGAGVPAATLELVHMRASQVNQCAVCVDLGFRNMARAGEPVARIVAVAAWRESPHFDDAERAALALTEAVTRLSDRSDPVPDEVWDAAARHFDAAALSSLVITIAATNAWNRINAATRQVAGSMAG
jgi:AhpD family alkylhydroperoxidase